MAASPTTAGGTPRFNTITFAEPKHEASDHAGTHAQETESDARSDDDTLAAPSDADKRDSKDEAPSFLERIKSAPKAVGKKLRLREAEFGGPSRHMNPTSAKLNLRRESEPGISSRTPAGDEMPGPSGDARRDLEVMWRSRDNRKGSVAVPVSPRGGSITMRMIFSSKDIGKGLKRMFTTFPYWDMSFWSGWSYSIGSALFVVDGFWAWLPVGWPDTEFSGESKYGVPLLFFFGALFYQLGAVMAYLEAINDGSFAGSAMKRLLLGHDREAKEILDEKLSQFFGHVKPRHHSHNEAEEEREKRESDVNPEAGWQAMSQRERLGLHHPRERRSIPRRGGLDLGEPEEGETVEYVRWRWWPTWHRFRTHHIYEIGYLSCTIQLFGVTLYGVTSIVILPGILSSLSRWQENAAYWIPQIVAASCFLIASFGFTWETQSKWYKPEFGVLGWWIGFWSVVGSVGFLLCAVFGICSYTSTGNEYQSELSTTWGSFAYLIGSMLQWYEAVNKHSVQDFLDGAADDNARLQPVGSKDAQRQETGELQAAPVSAEQTPRAYLT